MESNLCHPGILNQISTILVNLALNSKSTPNSIPQNHSILNQLQPESRAFHPKMNQFAHLNGMCLENFQLGNPSLSQSQSFSSLSDIQHSNITQNSNLGALNELLRIIKANNKAEAPLQVLNEKFNESKSYSSSSSVSSLSHLLQNDSPTSVFSSASRLWDDLHSKPRAVQSQTVQFSGSQRVLSQESYNSGPKRTIKAVPYNKPLSAKERIAVENDEAKVLNLDILDFSEIFEGCDFEFLDKLDGGDFSEQPKSISERAFCDVKFEESETSIFEGLDLQNVELLPDLDGDVENKASAESNSVFHVSQFDDLFSTLPLSEATGNSEHSVALSSDPCNHQLTKREENNGPTSETKGSISKKRKACFETDNCVNPSKRESVMASGSRTLNGNAFVNTSQYISSQTIQNVDVSYPPRRSRRRSEVTTSRAMASRMRRDKISNRLRTLYSLVPNGKSWDTASMLDETISYVRYLKGQAAEEDC